jgi:biotin carboxylase
MGRSRVLVVLGTNAWREWILPFLDDPRFDAEVQASADVRMAQFDAAVFLSRHDSLRRDLCFAGPLTRMGLRSLVCQPEAVVALAMDKRAMARRAAQIRGLHAIPELTPEAARQRLAAGETPAVVAKRSDGTEGQGMQIFLRADDLTTTGTRLYEGGYLLQPFVAGDEFSVNMVWHAGRCNVYAPVYKGPVSSHGVHPTRRKRLCPADVDGNLLELCIEYMRPFEPEGPVELEFIRRRGEYFLLDVNPRVSATLRMTAVASDSNPFADLIAAAVGAEPLGRMVPASRHAMEWPLGSGVSAERRAELATRDDLWISTRVTLAAPDEETLSRRAAELQDL